MELAIGSNSNDDWEVDVDIDLALDAALDVPQDLPQDVPQDLPQVPQEPAPRALTHEPRPLGLAATTPIPSSGSHRYAATELATPVPASQSFHAQQAQASQSLASQSLSEKQPLSPGDIVAGKYQIERILGEGGMGMVFAATHLQLREPVALKFMNAAALANPEASARFVREARAAARLRGEHVCRVLDLGETDEGDRYIVIEYLDGKDLSEVLAERHTLTVTEAVDYILQACEAMAEAHGAGIVHRDLKPANLFLTTGTDGAPCIKVVDFGISKLINPETNAQVVTTTRSLMGSPLYMAPEQLVSAKEVDARADVWALGTVLFQLISGRTPFEADSLPEVVAKVLHNAPPRLSAIVPASPRKLDSVIARCLEKTKQDRYESVAALAADLAEVVPEASHLAMRSAAVLGAARHSTVMPASRSGSKRKLIIGALLTAALAAAVSLGVIVAGGSGDSESATTDKAAPQNTSEAASKAATNPAPTKPAPAAAPPTADETPADSIEEPLIEIVEVDAAPVKRRKRPNASKRAVKDSTPAAASTKTPGELLEPDLDAPITKKKTKNKGAKAKPPAEPKSDVLAPDL